MFLADIARRSPRVAGPRRAVLEGGLIPSRTFELVRRMAGDLRLTFGGFTDPKGYEYFSVHIEADKEHSAAEREMLSTSVDNQNINNVRASVQRVLDALWEMLSGVCRRHAIAC